MPGREAINRCLKDGNSSCKFAVGLGGAGTGSPKCTAQVPKESWCWESCPLLWALSLKFFVALGKSSPSLFLVCEMG